MDLPLKAGFAIMALGALAQGINLTVVPVWMNYFHALKFRSRAVVEFGDPVEISPELFYLAVLVSRTMTAPDFETLMLINTARRLYSTDKRRIPLSTVIKINRRLVKRYTTHKYDPRIEKISKSIKHYNQQLQLLGLRDHQVEYARFSALRVVFSLLYRVGKICMLALGTLPRLILFSPIFIVARIYSHKKTKEALTATNVKIQGNDVMATWKILVEGGLAPLLHTYYAVIIALWTHYNRINGYIPEVVSIWSIILGAYIVFPMLTLAALRLGEICMDILKSLRPLVLTLICWNTSKTPRVEGIFVQGSRGPDQYTWTGSIP